MKRAFTLIETLSAVILIAMAAVLMSRLFVDAVRTTQAAPAEQTRMMRAASAEQVFRRDVWGAEKIDVKPAGVDLLVDGSTVTWSTDASGTLKRSTAGESPRIWPELFATFVSEAGGVKVELASGTRGLTDSIHARAAMVGLEEGGRP